jgi:hypothetical protein
VRPAPHPTHLRTPHFIPWPNVLATPLPPGHKPPSASLDLWCTLAGLSPHHPPPPPSRSHGRHSHPPPRLPRVVRAARGGQCGTNKQLAHHPRPSTNPQPSDNYCLAIFVSPTASVTPPHPMNPEVAAMLQSFKHELHGLQSPRSPCYSRHANA